MLDLVTAIMNNPKMQLNNTNSNSNNVNMNNNGSLKLPQWQQQQQQPLANYTLPGVINYLTSEFTDLERFKIMTNLEKSEMKYKIVQLQGELNSLRYINEKQKSRIDVLEKENQKLHSQLKHEGPDSQSESETKKEGTIKEYDIEIPEIDLLEIQKSRTQLTKSMRQVLHLLKTPHANNMNPLNLNNPADELNEYDDLIKNDKSDAFFFSEKDNTRVPDYSGRSRKYNKDSIFSQYLNDIPFDSQNHGSTEKTQDDLYQNNLTEVGDINAKSIQYLTQPSEEKEAFPSSNYKAEESDAETVIMDDSDDEKLELTKTKSNLATKPDTDSSSANYSPVKSESPSESNNVTEDMYSVKPNALITTNDHNYGSCRMFTSCLNNTIVYLNYEHNSDENLVLLNVWSTSLNKLVVSKEFTDTIVEKPTNIIDIYCVSHDESNLTIYLLIIYKSGTVDHIKLNENSQISKSCILNLAPTTLNSSKLIEFTHKSSPESRNFGLVVTGLQNPASIPFIKVYNLMVDAMNSIIETEIGSYVKSFFKLQNLQESDMFEVVHWFKNDDNTSITDASSQKPNKGKSHKRTVSCTDVSLSPYEIILKLGYQLIRFNFVLKKYYTLIDEQHGDTTKDVCFNDHLAIFVEVKEDIYKLRVYDLVKKTAISETNFNGSLAQNSSLILVSDQKKDAIARLDRTHIQFYDLNFSLLHHINISPLPNTLLYANDEIVLATVSNNSVENLAIYDLNTFTA